LDDSREELEVIKIPHRDLFRWGSAHSGGRPESVSDRNGEICISHVQEF
jgi:hypothetical protein